MGNVLLFIGVVALIIAYLYIKSGDVVQIGIIWITSALIVDLWVIFQKFSPGIEKEVYNLWWDKDYNEPLNALWYISGIGAYLSKVLFVYGASKLAGLYNIKLHKISIVFVFYYITQFGFWLWSKNTSVWANFWVYLCMAIATVYLIIPSSKYRRIDS